jgi:nucleotide-binding universal stress UspA family protein
VWALTATEERAGFSAAPVSAPEGGREGEDLGTQVLKTLHDAGAMGDFTQREGEIARELESLAAITAAQLIVVGRSHHPALHLGGVPRHLLAGGERLVLVVP